MMNQENNVPVQPTQITKPSSEGIDLKKHGKLMPKTVAELAEIQARGRKLFVKKLYTRPDPNALQYPKPKTKEEIKNEALQRQKEINDYSNLIHYSRYYYDDEHEYRHVVLPKGLVKWLPHRGLLTEEECLSLGITQSTGWVHYMVYAPEPHILLFKREKEYLKRHGLENLKVREEKSSTKVQQPLEKEVAPVPSEVAPPIIQNMRLTRSSTVNSKINK